MAKFPLKLSNKWKFSIAFLMFESSAASWPPAPDPLRLGPPYQPSLGEPRFLRALMHIVQFLFNASVIHCDPGAVKDGSYSPEPATAPRWGGQAGACET